LPTRRRRDPQNSRKQAKTPLFRVFSWFPISKSAGM
jgi:hypothetical protein